MFEKAGVDISEATDSNWLTTLASWLLPIIVLLGIWTFFSAVLPNAIA